MSIDRTQKITPATLPDIRHNGAPRANSGAVARTSSGRAGTRVSVNHPLQALSADSSQDLDYARLDAIKSALSAGELPIDTDKISHALVQDILTL